MTLDWQVYSDSKEMLSSSSIANDAIIGLNFLAIPSKIPEKSILEYKKNVQDGIALLEKLISFVEKTKHEKRGIDDYYFIKGISKNLLISKSSELKQELENAKQEMRNAIETQRTRTTKSVKILNVISSVTSNKIESFSEFLH